METSLCALIEILRLLPKSGSHLLSNSYGDREIQQPSMYACGRVTIEEPVHEFLR